MGNLPFRDPVNQERRFIPLRLDDAPTLSRSRGRGTGCIREDELRAGDLDYQDFKRLLREDEAVMLRWHFAAR
jgi:hypothetical protein